MENKMNAIETVLIYYINDESDKVKRIDNSNNLDDAGNVDKRQTDKIEIHHHYHDSTPWYLGWYPGLFDPVPNVNRMHRSNEHITQNVTNKPDRKTEKKETKDPEERDLVQGSLWTLITTWVAKLVGSSYVRYYRVNDDLHKLSSMNLNHPQNSVENIQLLHQAQRILNYYRSNRLWSLFNQTGLMFGAGALAAGFLLPASAFFVPGYVFIFGSCISGGLRCGVWQERVTGHQAELRILIAGIRSSSHSVNPNHQGGEFDRPPAYAPDNTS